MRIWWANDRKEQNDLHIGQVLTIPPVSGLVVEVGEVDTLSGLAYRYDVEPKTILDANGLADPNLVIGQTLVIPGGARRADRHAEGSHGQAQASRTRTVTKPRTTRPRVTVRLPSTYHGGSMLWPVVGGGNYISQYFHTGHYAIDIAADRG